MIAGQFVRLRSPPLTGAPVIGCPELWPPLHCRYALLIRQFQRIQSSDQRIGVAIAGQSFDVIADLHLLAAPGPRFSVIT